MHSLYSLILYFSLSATALGRLTDYAQTGCLGSGCCPSRLEMYPGDSLTLSTDGGSRGGTWCEHEVLVRLDDDVCTGCTFSVEFSDYSTPFTPFINIMESNYTSDLFYAPTFNFYTTAALVGGSTGQPPNTTFHTTGNIMRLIFLETDAYYGELTIKVNTVTPPFGTGIAIAVGIGAACAFVFIVAAVACCVMYKRKMARGRGYGVTNNVIY